MDSVINRASVYSTKTALDDFFEEKVDFDIIIPDYNPAAHNILKCEVMPSIVSRSTDTERTQLDIECVVCILYTDEDEGSIHSITKTETFSKTLAHKNALYPCKPRMTVRPISVNCRMQNSRKISVKAVIGTAVKIMGNSEVSLIDSIDDKNIQTVYSQMQASVFSGAGDTQTHITGKFESKSPVTDILYKRAAVTITNAKCVNEKVIVKGACEVQCVYMTGEGKSDMQFAKTSLPFSDVISVPNTTEDSICNCYANVQNIHCDIEDDGCTVSVEIDALLSAAIYNCVDINLLKDVYSTTDELKTTIADFTLESLCSNDNFSHNFEAKIPCDISDARIVATMGEPVVKRVAMQDKMLAVEGDVNLCIFMYNDNEYKILDKTVPFSISRKMPDCSGNLRCEAMSSICDISCSMPNDNEIELDISMGIDINYFEQMHAEVIDSFETDTENCPEICKGLVLYNAQKGEQLWDIAKKYHTSVNILKRDNNMQTDCVETPKILLVSFN